MLVVISRDASVCHTSMIYVNGIFRYVGVSNTSKWGKKKLLSIIFRDVRVSSAII